jgi:uncharacterized membrane protein YphA (DoxX/SURF4 family)
MSNVSIADFKPGGHGMSGTRVTLGALWLHGRHGDRSAWMALAARIFGAAVWFTFGTVFKILGAVPRHREIVAEIIGRENAPLLTGLIGFAETALGLWFLSGFFPRSCAVTQTIAIVSMNAMELVYARSFLLAPVPMVYANAIFLALVWYAALWAPARKDPNASPFGI